MYCNIYLNPLQVLNMKMKMKNEMVIVTPRLLKYLYGHDGHTEEM